VSYPFHVFLDDHIADCSTFAHRRDPDSEQQAQGEANAENDIVLTTGRIGQMKAHASSVANSGSSFYFVSKQR
jgi:hypothetical protein